MTRPGRVIQLFMLTTIAINRASVALAADRSETLDADVSGAYVTNPALLPGSNVADRFAQFMVDGNTQISTETSQLTVTPRLSLLRYDQEKNLDTTSGSVTLAFRHNGERDRWTSSGLAQTDSTLTTELGQTGITNVNYRRDLYNASVGYEYLSTERLSWQVQGTGQIVRYSSGADRYGLVGYSYGGISIGPTWNFTERVLGSINFETDEVSAQNHTSQKDYSGTLQLKRHLNEKYSWRVSAGATRVEFPGSQGATTSGVFELGATRQGERVQWDLSVRQAVVPIGFGLLARQDAAAVSVAVGISERSTLSLSASAIRSYPVSLTLYLAPEVSLRYQIYSGAAWEQLSAEWQYHLSRAWALSAAFALSRARNYDFAEWANSDLARVGIIWQSGRI